jgi:hypothetical protein
VAPPSFSHASAPGVGGGRRLVFRSEALISVLVVASVRLLDRSGPFPVTATLQTKATPLIGKRSRLVSDAPVLKKAQAEGRGSWESSSPCPGLCEGASAGETLWYRAADAPTSFAYSPKSGMISIRPRRVGPGAIRVGPVGTRECCLSRSGALRQSRQQCWSSVGSTALLHAYRPNLRQRLDSTRRFAGIQPLRAQLPPAVSQMLRPLPPLAPSWPLAQMLRAV